MSMKKKPKRLYFSSKEKQYYSPLILPKIYLIIFPSMKSCVSIPYHLKGVKKYWPPVFDNNIAVTPIIPL